MHLAIGINYRVVRALSSLLIHCEVRIVVADILLTGHTPTQTQFEVVDWRSILHECHVVNLPAQSQCREETPTSVFAEARRSIVTKSESEQVGVLQSVVETTEERDELQFVHPRDDGEVLVSFTDMAAFRRIGDKGVSAVGISHRSTVACAGKHAVVVPTAVFEVLPRVTYSEVEVRIDSVNSLLVVQVSIKKGVLLQLIGVLINAWTVAEVVVPSQRRVVFQIIVFFSAAPVVTEVYVNVEVFEAMDSIVELQVTVRTEHVGIVVASVDDCNRVVGSVDVVRSTVTPYEVTIVELRSGVFGHLDSAVINRMSRVESYSSTYSATSVNEVVAEVVALHIELYAQVVVEELRSKVDTCSDTLHAWVGHDTLVVGEVGRNAIRQESGSTTDAQVVVLRDCGAEHFVLPICVGIAKSTVSLRIFAPEILDYVAISACIKHIPSATSLIDIHIGREVDLRFAFLTFLGGDDDYTVRCTRTIDSGSWSILEDSHRFDVVRRNHCQGVWHTLHAGTVDGHTVNHNQRVVVGVQRRTTTHTDSSACLRVTAAGCYNHTRRFTNQKVLCRRSKTGFNLVRLNHRDWTRCIFFLHNTVTDGYDFLKNHAARWQLDCNVRFTIDRNGSGLIAYITNRQRSVGIYVKDEFTVKVGSRSGFRPLVNHTGTDYRLAILIDNGALHCYLLWKRRKGKHHCHKQGQNAPTIQLKTKTLHSRID